MLMVKHMMLLVILQLIIQVKQQNMLMVQVQLKLVLPNKYIYLKILQLF